MLRTIIIALLLCTVADAGTIRLRDGVVVEPGEPVTLGCVAKLEGADATGLAAMQIRAADAPMPACGWLEIDVAAVRRALDESGVAMGRLAVSGRSCTVRVRAEAPVEAPALVEAPAQIVTKGPTIRTEVIAALAERYGVAVDELRATFEAPDEEFLSTPSGAGRIVVSPTSTPGAARAVAQVRVVSGASIKASRTIRADIEVLRDVLVLKSPLRSREAITAGSFDSERRWVAPSSGDVISSFDGLEGSLARTRVAAGTVLRREHLESPVVMKRNELVTVYMVSSGFEIRTRARARADARIGDVLEFRAEGSKRSFMARVDGPGVAVAEGPTQTVADADRQVKEDSR